MNLEQFKRRELDECYVVVYVIKTEIEITYEERLCKRNLYLLVGINMEGKRKYLTYGVKYRDNSDFWLQLLNGLVRRGVKKVLYFSVDNNEQVKRAVEITFPKVKVVGTPFTGIEKLSRYFSDNYKNTMPEEIRKMYILKDLVELNKQKEYFFLKYEDKQIVKILIGKEIEGIDKYYEIPHNIRKLIFSYYFIRDYKIIFKREINKEKNIENPNIFFERFIEMIIGWEKIMYLSKKEWYEVITELISVHDIGEYL